MVCLACTLCFYFTCHFLLSSRVNCYKILIMVSSNGSSIIFFRNKSVVNSIMKTFAILLILVLIVAFGNCTDPSKNKVGVKASE